MADTDDSTTRFKTWNRASLLFGIPLFAWGLFVLIRFVVLSASMGFAMPGFGVLTMLLTAFGLGGLFLSATPDHFVLDKAANTVTTWHSPVAKLHLTTIQMAGKTAIRIVGFYRRRRKTKSYRIEVLSADGSVEKLTTLGIEANAQEAGKAIGEFFGLPVEGP